MNFVRQRLAQFIVAEYLKTPNNWPGILKRAVMNLDKMWIRKVQERSPKSKSGTTLTVCVLEGRMLHAAWTGDSPAWLQMANGEVIQICNTVHRPGEEVEKQRIHKAGGQVVHQDYTVPGFFCIPSTTKRGPARCYPGGLNISRSLGDARHKVPELGGTHGVIIATPDVNSMQLPDQVRFLVLATDGITDHLRKGPGQLAHAFESGFTSGCEAINGGRLKLVRGQTKAQAASDIAAERALFASLKKNKSTYQDNATVLAVSFLDGLSSQFPDLGTL
jgi:serine/threonine protein phosphatase PrpC